MMTNWRESLRMKLHGWLITKMYAPHMDGIGEAPPGYGPDAYQPLPCPGPGVPVR